MSVKLFDGKARVGISGNFLMYHSDYADHQAIVAQAGKPRGLTWDPDERKWKVGLENVVAVQSFIDWLETNRQDAFAVEQMIENGKNQKFNMKKSNFLDLIWRNKAVKQRLQNFTSFESIMKYIDTASILTNEFFVFYSQFKAFYVVEIQANSNEVLLFKHELIDNSKIVLSVSTKELDVSGSLTLVTSQILQHHSEIYYDLSTTIFEFPKQKVTDEMVLEDLGLVQEDEEVDESVQEDIIEEENSNTKETKDTKTVKKTEGKKSKQKKTQVKIIDEDFDPLEETNSKQKLNLIPKDEEERSEYE
jgi:hypothetical protein